MKPIWVQWMTARFAAYSVFIAVYARRRRATNQALCYLGLISYSIYLMHPFVFGFFSASLYPWLILCFWLTILLLIASATYRWVERPSIRLGQRLAHPRASVAAHNPTNGN
jgi:peptidoglycan/LPS O-acetylase OafA/YrhL